MKNVFFVLLGRGSFLSYVGMRPSPAEILRSSFNFSQLNIYLLRPEAIKTILEKTVVNTVENRTIREACELDNAQLDGVAKHLFHETCGHPRSLMMVFKTCRSFSEFVKYSQPVGIENWTLFYDELQKYKYYVKCLLEKKTRTECVNLNDQVKDVGGRLISLDIIANNCCIAWEGTVEKAKLYASPFVLQLILQYVFPLQEYIRAMEGSKCSIDYPTVFEWICLKRFQEMFNSAQSPNDVLPEYFNENQAFGGCSRVSFTDNTRKLPKITRNGLKNPELDSLTADPSAWPQLLQKISAGMIHDSVISVCLKPLPKFVSSDALLMTWIDDVLLTLGLAVKNFKSTGFSEVHLREECDVFNRMFSECRDTQKRLNMLVVCATKYNTTFSGRFNMQKSVLVQAAHCPCIHEVILLDLSIPLNRACFFGISEYPDLSKALEAVISKVEVEFSETP